MSEELPFIFDSFANDLGQSYPLDRNRGVIGAEALVDALRKVEHDISVFLSDKSRFMMGPSVFRVAILPKGESPSSTGSGWGGDKLEFFGLAEVNDTHNYLKEHGVTEEQIGLVRGCQSKFIFEYVSWHRRFTDKPENYLPLSVDELDRRIRERQAQLGL